MKALRFLLLLALLPSLAWSGQTQYDVVATIVLPKGDVSAGRQAFQDLKCHACHRVAGRTGLPGPIAEARER